jgi:hypothetical protein
MQWDHPRRVVRPPGDLSWTAAASRAFSPRVLTASGREPQVLKTLILKGLRDARSSRQHSRRPKSCRLRLRGPTQDIRALTRGPLENAYCHMG